MKIALPCKIDDPMSPLEERFGAARNFAIYDDSTRDLRFVKLNEFLDGGSAGLFLARQLIDIGVSVVVAGRIEPNVQQLLHEKNIRIIENQYGHITEVLKDYHRYGPRLS